MVCGPPLSLPREWSLAQPSQPPCQGLSLIFETLTTPPSTHGDWDTRPRPDPQEDPTPSAQHQAHLCPGLRSGDGSLLPGSWRLPSRLSHGWAFPLPLSQENPDPHKNCSDSCTPHAHPVETQPAPEPPLRGPSRGGARAVLAAPPSCTPAHSIP